MLHSGNRGKSPFDGTLDGAENAATTLRVAVCHAPPWVDVCHEHLRGREVDTLAWIAGRMDLAVDWHLADTLSSKPLLNGEIDLMIGAIPASPELLGDGVRHVMFSPFQLTMGEPRSSPKFAHVWLYRETYPHGTRLAGLVLLHRLLRHWLN